MVHAEQPMDYPCTTFSVSTGVGMVLPDVDSFPGSWVVVSHLSAVTQLRT